MKTSGINALSLVSAIVLAFLPASFGQNEDLVMDEGVVPNQIVVRFHENRSDRSSESGLFMTSGAIGKQEFRFGSHTMTLVFPESTDLVAKLTELRRDPRVRFAFFNRRVNLSVVPNDSHFGQQWNLHNTGQGGGTPNVDIDGPEAWDNTTGSGSVTVAIVDTGVRATHEDLAANLIAGWNHVTNSSDVSDTSANSHGTAVTGIIGARGGNGVGVAGINWNISMMPLVWLVSGVDPQEAHAVAAMADARTRGVKIVSCSFNAGFPLDGVKDEIQQGNAQGVLYVFSAGNSSGQNTPGVSVDTGAHNAWPCKNVHPNLICVTAVDKNGNRPLWANYGVKGVHLGAPGDDIFTTLKGHNADYGKPWAAGVQFPPGSGTSYAAPHVTGVAALMKALNPGYTMKQIREYLLLAAQPTPTGSLDGTTHMGGMLNADVAVLGFGDSFDDAANNSRFFSNATTGARWAVGYNGTGVSCGNYVKEVDLTVDRVAHVTYSGVAGTPGSTWTLAGFKNNYPPGDAVQTLAFRVTTPDGSHFSGKSGRIGGGIVGQTGLSQKTCAATLQGYTQMSFGGSMIAGIELHTGKPFIHFDPPYVEHSYPSISLVNRKKLSISVGMSYSFVRFRITDSTNGQQLFSQDVPYPGNWNWTGIDKPAFIYYGNTSQSGELYVRSFVSARP